MTKNTLGNSDHVNIIWPKPSIFKDLEVTYLLLNSPAKFLNTRHNKSYKLSPKPNPSKSYC